MKRLSTINILRNQLCENIKFDKEMHSLYIPYMSNDDCEQMLKRVHKLSKQEKLSIADLKALRKEMNRELRACLYKIDGYSH